MFRYFQYLNFTGGAGGGGGYYGGGGGTNYASDNRGEFWYQVDIFCVHCLDNDKQICSQPWTINWIEIDLLFP